MIFRRTYQKEKVTPSASEEDYTGKTKTYAALFNTSFNPALEVLKEAIGEVIPLQKASLASLACLPRQLSSLLLQCPNSSGRSHQ